MSHVAIRRAASMATAGGLLLSVGIIGALPASAQVDAKGPSYTIVYETQLSGGAANTGVLDPAAPASFKAAYAAMPVTIDVCDDQGTTTGNIDCEHEAVADHAAVYVPTQANEDQSLVDAANIPVVGVANDTAPQSFDISAQQGLFVGMAEALAKKGCTKLGIVIDEGGQSYGNQVANAIKWKSVTDAYIPVSAPDLSPDIAKLVQAHVQCVAAAMLPTQIPQALTAMKQAKLSVPVAFPGITFTPSVISSLGSLGNGVVEVVSTPPLSAPASTAVAKKIHAVNKGVTVDESALTSWALAKVIQDGAANVHGAVTSTSLLAALDKLRNAGTDNVLPPLSMKSPSSNPAAARDFDTYVESVILEHGQQTDPSGFFDIAPQLGAALSSN